ncbi:MAG TPA: SCP2 sterol-binding domain-containing protein [Candidatus Anoxymicrobiaceae bacterium]|jgi:hypothetical protein
MNPGGTGDLEINIAPGAEENGMAVMLAEMIKTNLGNKPERLKDFHKLNGTIWISATDAEVDMSMEFKHGALTVRDGKVGKPILVIATDSSTLLDLANINIKMGLPYYFDETGRMVIKKLLSRELKIKGLVMHTMALTHMTKIMSVN